MNSMLVWQSARNNAQQIRDTFPVGNEGIRDLVGIAQHLGATIYTAPLEPAISGFIIKDPHSDPRIYINENASRVRQRFTLAHELGHLVERMQIAGDDDYSFVDHRKPGSYDLHEFFADEFAGALLMPSQKLRSMEENHLSVYEMAKQLGVSVSAVNKRLERLQTNPDAEGTATQDRTAAR